MFINDKTRDNIGVTLRIIKQSLFLVFLLCTSTIILQTHATDSDEIIFPSNVKSMTYKTTVEYAYEGGSYSYAYHYEEALYYEIIDVKPEENTFSIVFTAEVSLISYEGLEPVAAEYTYSNDTKIRRPFSKQRSISYGATRIVDLFDGKVMEIENQGNIPTEINFVFTNEGESEEQLAPISSGIANVGYIPFAWIGKYETLDPETILRSTPAGKYECLRSTFESIGEYWTANSVKYYEQDSGILINREWIRTLNTDWVLLGASGKYEIKTELINIEHGRTWDKINVDLSISDDRIDVDEEPIVVTMATYAYDSAPFEGEINLNSPTLTRVGKYTYNVSGVSDPIYGITQYQSNDVTCILDRMKIIDGGVSNSESKVKESETVWFKAVYEYDDEVFDGSKGTLEINGESGQWSETNQRWELMYTPDEPTSMTFEVTGIIDETYGLTSLNDIAGKQTIEWKSAGIPGFPIGAILLGILLSAYVLMNTNRIGVYSQGCSYVFIK